MDTAVSQEVSPAVMNGVVQDAAQETPAGLDQESFHRVLFARKGHESTVTRYMNEMQHFLAWARRQGWEIPTLPADAVGQYLHTRGGAPESKRFVKSALVAGFDALREMGQAVPQLDMPVIEGKTPRLLRPPPAEVPASVATPSPAAATPAEQPVQRVTKNANILKVPGKVKVSKRSNDVTEGAAPGALIFCGEFNADDVSTEGTIGNFLTRYIVPKFGPKPGGRDVVYVVDILNSNGGVTGSYQLPIAAPVADAPPPQVPVAQPFYPPQPAPQSTEQVGMVLETMRGLLDRSEASSAARMQELREHSEREGRGMDPMALMLLQQQSQRELDLIKAQTDKMLTELRTAPPAAPLAGLDFSSPRPDPMAEKSAEIMARLAERAFAPPARDPLLERLLEIQTRPREEEKIPRWVEMQMDAQKEQTRRLEMMLEKMLTNQATPVKSAMEQVTETLGAVTKLREVVGADDGPAKTTLTDVAAMFVENADKIGEATRKILSALPQKPSDAARAALGAPALPAPAPAKPPPAVQGPAPKKVMPLPAPAKAAIKALITSQDPTVVLEHAYALLTALSAGGHPWDTLVERVGKQLLTVRNRGGLWVVVTNLLYQCVGERYANEVVTPEVIGKIVGVLHRAYPQIHAQFVGTERHLDDEAAGDAPVAPAAEDAGDGADGDAEEAEYGEGQVPAVGEAV